MPTSRICGGSRHGFWAPKFAVVESRVCGAEFAFRLAGNVFWGVGWTRFWGAGWGGFGVGNAGVFVSEMKGLCRWAGISGEEGFGVAENEGVQRAL